MKDVIIANNGEPLLLFFSSNLSKPAIHGTKISQKQRKMIAMAARECSSGARSGDSTPLKSSPSTLSTTEKAWLVHTVPLFIDGFTFIEG